MIFLPALINIFGVIFDCYRLRHHKVQSGARVSAKNRIFYFCKFMRHDYYIILIIIFAFRILIIIFPTHIDQDCYRQVGGLMQHEMGLAINDDTWLHTFLTIANTRLQESYRIAIDTLERLHIAYVPSPAGFFVWINLAHLLTAPSIQAESDFWLELIEHGLFLRQTCHVTVIVIMLMSIKYLYYL